MAETTPAAAPTAAAAERRNRKSLTGVVISNKMEKTITVEVTRLVKHALYGKYVRRRSRFKAHDEKNVAKIGDTVIIVESRPLSRTKRWRLQGVVSASSK
jgi:small subunit ribosomal protein S17